VFLHLLSPPSPCLGLGNHSQPNTEIKPESFIYWFLQAEWWSLGAQHHTTDIDR